MWKKIKTIVLLASIVVFLCGGQVYAFFPSQSWAEQEGYGSAFDYWCSISPNLACNAGTLNDHMVDYLANNGYSGNLVDMLHAYLVSETGQASTNSLNDLMLYYNENITLAATDDFIFADTNNFYFADGNNFVFAD